MTSHMLRVAFAVLFLTFCVGQVGGSHDTDPVRGLQLIRSILHAADVSGWLASCRLWLRQTDSPDLPPFGVLDESGRPQETLKKLFSADPLMQVTQEGNMIRMMETNVATNVLNHKIHHVSFFPSDVWPPIRFMAQGRPCLPLLETSEVVAFGKAHNIR